MNCVILFLLCFKVQFVKEGCGSDHECQSDLQLKYKFHTTELSKDVFEPLPE